MNEKLQERIAQLKSSMEKVSKEIKLIRSYFIDTEKFSRYSIETRDDIMRGYNELILKQNRMYTRLKELASGLPPKQRASALSLFDEGKHTRTFKFVS